MATTITLENNVHLERLLMSGNKKMENKVRKIVRQLVREARDKVATATEPMLRNDPRKTAHAIRSTVYKEVIGANLNILSSPAFTQAVRGMLFHCLQFFVGGF